jgi:hypothetical protein
MILQSSLSCSLKGKDRQKQRRQGDGERREKGDRFCSEPLSPLALSTCHFWVPAQSSSELQTVSHPKPGLGRGLAPRELVFPSPAGPADFLADVFSSWRKKKISSQYLFKELEAQGLSMEGKSRSHFSPEEQKYQTPTQSPTAEPPATRAGAPL